jgi:hypothetical protein
VEAVVIVLPLASRFTVGAKPRVRAACICGSMPTWLHYCCNVEGAAMEDGA